MFIILELLSRKHTNLVVNAASLVAVLKCGCVPPISKLARAVCSGRFRGKRRSCLTSLNTSLKEVIWGKYLENLMILAFKRPDDDFASYFSNRLLTRFVASREVYFRHLNLHALNSTGMSQVLVHKSPCVLTKDGVTSSNLREAHFKRCQGWQLYEISPNSCR